MENLMIQYRTLSDGTEVALPIRYIDNRCLAATFLTDLERAAQVLEGTGLQAVPQEDGKAVVLRKILLQLSMWQIFR